MSLKEEKVSFIDDAHFRGKSTPSHYKINYEPILNRTMITHIRPSKDQPGDKIKHIIDKNPSPG